MTRPGGHLPPVLSKEETARLLRVAHGTDRSAAADAEALLVSHNMRIVVQEVRKVSTPSSSVEDLEAAGAAGLLRAVRRCDPERPWGWYRLAVAEVRNALRGEVRATGRGLSLSDRAARYAGKVARARRETDGPLDPRDVAERFGVPFEAAEALTFWTSPGALISTDVPGVDSTPGVPGVPGDVDVAAAVESLPERLQQAAADPDAAGHAEALARLAHPSRLWRAA